MVPLKESSTSANAFLSLGKALNLSSFFCLAPWQSCAAASVRCNAQQHTKASLTWCLNGIKGWLYWKVKGGKDTFIVPGLFFTPCSIYPLSFLKGRGSSCTVWWFPTFCPPSPTTGQSCFTHSWLAGPDTQQQRSTSTSFWKEGRWTVNFKFETTF